MTLDLAIKSAQKERIKNSDDFLAIQYQDFIEELASIQEMLEEDEEEEDFFPF